MRRIERDLELARTKLALERAHRQPESTQLRRQQLDNRVELVDAQLSQIMVAVGKQAHRRWRRRLGCIFGTKPVLLELHHVKLDLEPGHVIVAGVGKAFERAPVEIAR